MHHFSNLVGVLCNSAGVLLVEVHVVGAVALLRDPAEKAATSLTGADRGSLSGEELTLLLVHGPG